MRKIKITLTSGNTIEKPLITAFKGTYGDYLVLDNESVGSMGLPVILISKIQDNKVSTIVDANEWNAIKENLRNIIAGNQIIKINVLDAYTGEDIFYKQLTLPVASFDTLKNTYGDDAGGAIPAPAPAQAPVVDTPVAPAVETPVTPAASVMPEVANPSSVNPSVPPVAPSPVAPEAPSINPTPDVAPVMPTPEVPNVPPVAPANVNPDVVTPSQTVDIPTPPVANVAPEVAPSPVAPEPVVEPIPNVNEQATPIDFSAEKEMFLKACENMFDALVSKFNK